MGRPHLYVNSKGWEVTRHSYSGSDSFNYCARKYFLERVQGWQERIDRSSKHFGTTLEHAIIFWHQRGQNITEAVAEFNRVWREHHPDELAKRKVQQYSYTKSDMDWDRLSLTGQELVRLYAIRYPNFPYIVRDPMTAFQVETNIEVFPSSKLAGIEFTSYIDLVAYIKESPMTPMIIDMKTSGKDVPEYTALDPQLRSYAWVKGWPDVAFLWFRKCGRQISSGDAITLLEPRAGLSSGADAVVISKDDFGLFVTQNKRDYDEMGAQFKGTSKAVEAARKAYIESHGILVPESAITKQRVQFKSAIITPESSEDIGRAIKRDIIAITQATEKDFFPMQSGVRFPNEKCPMCAMRGICSGNSDLRDALLMRKQLDEFDFGRDTE
jgi:PD-(D/E)XK nuclease superfamily